MNLPLPSRWVELFQSAIEAVRMRLTPLERQVRELNAQVEGLLAAQRPVTAIEVPLEKGFRVPDVEYEGFVAELVPFTPSEADLAILEPKPLYIGFTPKPEEEPADLLPDRETPMTGTRREPVPTLDLSKPSAPRCSRSGCKEPALPQMSLCAGCSS